MSRADGADAPYWQGLAGGRLLLPRCDGCDRWLWPAGHRCGACGTTGVHWEERAAAGTVFAWTRTWHRFALTEAMDLPFTSALIEVADCGVRLLGRLDDPDRVDPRIGERVSGRFDTTQVGEDRIPTIVWSRTA